MARFEITLARAFGAACLVGGALVCGALAAFWDFS